MKLVLGINSGAPPITSGIHHNHLLTTTHPPRMSSGALSVSQLSTRKPEPCCICLETISECAVTSPCNHFFDFLCLVSWLQEHTTCPLCKAHVTRVEYDWRSPDDYVTYIPTQDKKIASATSAARVSPLNSQGRRPPSQLPRRSRPPRRSDTLSPDKAILRRRYVYRHHLLCLHVGSNRLSKFKDFTTKDFSASLELQARARKWIRRELQVFDFLSVDAPELSSGRLRRAENAEFLLLYIISILKTVDIKGSSGKAEELVGAYLGQDNAKLFLHELEAWLRSPYVNLEDFDRVVQYKTPLPSFAEQGRDNQKGQNEQTWQRRSRDSPQARGITTIRPGYIPD